VTPTTEKHTLQCFFNLGYLAASPRGQLELLLGSVKMMKVHRFMTLVVTADATLPAAQFDDLIFQFPVCFRLAGVCTGDTSPPHIASFILSLAYELRHTVNSAFFLHVSHAVNRVQVPFFKTPTFRFTV